jgi:hypothetical protein
MAVDRPGYHQPSGGVDLAPATEISAYGSDFLTRYGNITQKNCAARNNASVSNDQIKLHGRLLDIPPCPNEADGWRELP